MNPQNAIVRYRACVPRFSIIVPTWQRAATLPRCLASIAAQPGSWECIVVDDGSTDATSAVVDDWSRRDSRFRMLRQTNRGPSVARNTGILAATGDWLAFMDSDDEYLPGALAVLSRAMASSSEARVVCGGLTGTFRVDARSVMDGRIVVRDAFADTLGFSVDGLRIQLIAAAFHRSVFDVCGAFATAYRSSEDRELLVRVTARYPVTIARTFVARYHEGHGDSASDRSLIDGTKLIALHRMLTELVEQPVVQPRLTPTIMRLRDAHLGMLAAATAVRAGDVRLAGARLASAFGPCDPAEREALLIRFVYLITYPATDPRGAAERAAWWLDELGRCQPAIAGLMSDASVGVRLWAALVLSRNHSIPAGAALAISTLRAAGVRRAASTVIGLARKARRGKTRP